MTEYGLFTNEGCIDAGMWSETEASRALRALDEDTAEDAYIAAICEEHAEQPANACDDCMAEEQDDEDEE